MIETRQEFEKRWQKCEDLLKSILGTSINQKEAKNIYKLQKGGFRFNEQRISNDMTIVEIQRQYENQNLGEYYIFSIKGALGNKLNMR
jgi:hypothetical protein